MANFELVWNARISGVTPGSALGLFLVYNGSSYIPATTTNLALYEEVQGCIYSVPSDTLAIIQQAGAVEASITGVTNLTRGYAVLNASGYAVWTATPTPGSKVVGVFEGGLLKLSLNDTSDSAANANAIQYISPLEWGAVGDGVTDDTVGFQTAVDAIRTAGINLQANYVFYITPLPSGRAYVLTDSIVMDNDTSGRFAGVRTMGGAGAPGISAHGCADIRWRKPKRAVSNATINIVATQASAAATTIRASVVSVVMSGAAIAAIAPNVQVGEQFICTASSYANFVGFHTVLAVTATTITVGGVGTAAGYPATLTATDMRVRDYMFKSRSRENTFEGFLVDVDLASAYLDSIIMTGESPEAGSEGNSSMVFKDVILTASAGGAGHICDCGPEYLPLAGNANYVLDSGTGLPLPKVPNNCDFYVFDHCQTSYGSTGAVLFTMNYSGQSRGHILRNCVALGAKITDVMHNTGSAYQASIAFSVYEPTTGATPYALMEMGREQAPSLLVYPHMENSAKLLVMDRGGSASMSELTVLGGYYNLVGNTGTTGAVDTPFVNVYNCSMSMVGAKFDLADNSNRGGGVDWFGFQGNYPRLTLIGCTLPHENMLNGGKHFSTALGISGYAVLTMIGCRAYDANTTILYEIDNVYNLQFTTSFNASYGGGSHLTGVKGLSATQVKNVNFIGTATVTGAATTAVWTFGTAETSATKLYAWPVAISSTGAPAAGSADVLTSVTTTTEVTLTVKVAPGVGNSVTFAIALMRGA